MQQLRVAGRSTPSHKVLQMVAGCKGHHDTRFPDYGLVAHRLTCYLVLRPVLVTGGLELLLATMLPIPSPADHPLVVRLPYSIFSASSYSARYVPENIQVNAPEDQSSRWSGAHAGSQVKHKQWIMVKLDQISVVSQSFPPVLREESLVR